MSWAIVAQRAAISPLVFVNRFSMAIDISFVRHQFMAKVALIFFVIYFQMFFHLHDVVEQLTTHGTRRHGVKNRSSIGNGRIFLFAMMIFQCVLSNWDLWKSMWWRGWCIRNRRILLIALMIFQSLLRNWNLWKWHLIQRSFICCWKVRPDKWQREGKNFNLYLDHDLTLVIWKSRIFQCNWLQIVVFLQRNAMPLWIVGGWRFDRQNDIVLKIRRVDNLWRFGWRWNYYGLWYRLRWNPLS